MLTQKQFIDTCPPDYLKGLNKMLVAHMSSLSGPMWEERLNAWNAFYSQITGTS